MFINPGIIAIGPQSVCDIYLKQTFFVFFRHSHAVESALGIEYCMISFAGILRLVCLVHHDEVDRISARCDGESSRFQCQDTSSRSELVQIGELVIILQLGRIGFRIIESSYFRQIDRQRGTLLDRLALARDRG